MIALPELEIRLKAEQITVTVTAVKDAVADNFDKGQFCCNDGYSISIICLFRKDMIRNDLSAGTFYACAGSCSDDVSAAVVQGNGAAVWALRKEQEKRQCFVLAPHYPGKVCGG